VANACRIYACSGRGGVFGWEKDVVVLPVRGRRKTRHSWCFREDLSRWLEVVVSLEVEKRRGKVRPAEEKKNLGNKMIFYKLCTLISFPSNNEMQIYLYGMEDRYLFCNCVNSWPLVQLQMISTIDLKWAFWAIKSDRKKAGKVGHFRLALLLLWCQST